MTLYGYSSHQEYLNCFIDCGPELESIRTPLTYQYAYQLWWTTSLVETMAGPPDEQFIGFIISGVTPDIIVHHLANDISNLGGISYCWNVQVIISYDDGLCCSFTDSGCVNRA